MRKKLTMILLFVSMLLLMVGCGHKGTTTTLVQTPQEAAKMSGDPLNNLKIKEAEWLTSVDQAKTQVDQAYADWQAGKLSKEDFQKQLNQPLSQVKGTVSAYNMFIKANPMPDSEKASKQYVDGLNYGRKMRTELNNFIFLVQKGILDSETKKFKPLKDKDIQDLYQSMIKENYNAYHDRLKATLK